MSDVNALRNYGDFQAARTIVSNVSSATDVRLVDVTQVAEEAATDPFVTWLAVEHQGYLFRPPPRVAGDVSSTSGPNLVTLIGQSSEAEFIGRNGDFASLDEMRRPEGQIIGQIRSLRGSPQLVYRERLARRLEFLLDEMRAEGEAWNEGSPESLRMMLLFLQTVPHFRYPTVTITPSATFRAQWTFELNRHFAADFLPDGQVVFVVFCPDPRHPDRIQRISGITSRANLLTVVEPYKIHHWGADAGIQNPR